MTRVDLAVLVTADGTRYKLKGWRNGSHEVGEPSRPAKLLKMTETEGWERLTMWNGAKEVAKGHYHPKPDDQVIDEALERLQVVHGHKVEELIYIEGSGTDNLGHPLGYGHKSNRRHESEMQSKVIAST